jgi:hypothetical protein
MELKNKNALLVECFGSPRQGEPVQQTHQVRVSGTLCALPAGCDFPENLGIFTPSDSCVVCMDASPTVVLDCGHCVLCRACNGQVKTCLMCRPPG